MPTDPPIIIEGPEQSRLDPERADGGLSPVVGVQSFQVFRASRDVPELSDGKGWTYHHHVDMACWKGRLYVGWNSCERDEDVWPSRELYATSDDGRSWTEPAELFPQGVSTPLRMYFYRAHNGKMLAIAGARLDTADTAEDRKGPLVVREIRADHTLGDVYALQGDLHSLSPYAGRGQGRGDSADAVAHEQERRRPTAGPSPEPSPRARGEGVKPFTDSDDSDFIAACRQLLADTVYLEQQDRGRLLGDRRMAWHAAAAWPAGAVPGDDQKWVAGKAYSFFRNNAGLLVGISKMGWTTTSSDDGVTWSQPSVPPTLITGKAKVWAQRTSDGRYALVYNPSRKHRYPLIIVTGDDGVHFRDMRLVQGELPIQRYQGVFRSIGPQYVRGISQWSDDGSRAGEGTMWLVYSMSKEDIWVSRVPVPVRADVGPDEESSAWNIYCPRWSSVSTEGNELRLEDRDPYDYTVATRVFPAMTDARVTFDVLAEQPAGLLDVDVLDAIDPIPVARLSIMPDEASAWRSYEIAAERLHRITFRTGPARGVGGTHPVSAGTDRPTKPTAFRVRNLRVRTEG